MLRTLKELFGALQSPPQAAAAQTVEHTLQLATAVMLVEVMRADASFHASERAAVHAALREKFALSDDERELLTTAILLAQHLEDGQVRVAGDQRLHRRAHLVQRLAEAFLLAGLQRLAEAAHALLPQRGQLLGRRAGDQLLRPAQLGQVDQRAARELRLHLLDAAHHLPAREQQGVIGVTNVERQRLADGKAVLDGGELRALHGDSCANVGTPACASPAGCGLFSACPPPT